jgi:hypothetical protein
MQTIDRNRSEPVGIRSSSERKGEVSDEFFFFGSWTGGVEVRFRPTISKGVVDEGVSRTIMFEVVRSP